MCKKSKSIVVAFRLEPEVATRLMALAKEKKIVGVRSGSQLARHVVLDFVHHVTNSVNN